MQRSETKAEVIAIGDELVNGQRLDTNSQWLSRALGEIGVRVAFHSTVGDDLEENLNVFRRAVERSDLILTTGGLGPTADDLTRDVLSRLAGVSLQVDEMLLRQIRQMFEKRGRKMPERNRVQAMFPEGSTPINNPHGTAPGIELEVQREQAGSARVYALPGVPAEMRDMWEASVCDSILRSFDIHRRSIRHRRLKCFGLGESEMERRLPDLIARGREPLVGITASNATITLRITAHAATEAECRALIEPTEQVIRSKLGELVFGEEDDELQHAVSRLLLQQKLTIAVVEYATLGMVASWMRDVVEAGSCFRGGIIAGHPIGADLAVDARRQADSSHEQRPRFSSANDDDLKQTAQHIRNWFDADIGLAIGEITSPPTSSDPTSAEGEQHDSAVASALPASTVPYIPMAISDPRGELVARHPIAGHPEIMVPRAAKQALDLVRRRWIRKVRESTDSRP